MSSLSGLFLVDTTGINGSGTAGNIMKWQDADSATNSIIYDNGTNIGIGTSSPFTAGSQTSLSINGASYGRLDLYGGGTHHLYAYGGSGFAAIGATSSATNGLIFEVNGSERMRIDSSGNVGIGTSSPTAFSGTILHIHDTSISRLKLTNDTTGATNTDGFEIYVAGSDAVLLNRESANLKFSTNDSERMCIDSSGNVGIGTSSPSYKLEVRDTADAVIALVKTGANSLRFLSTSSGGVINQVDNNNLAFKTNDTERMRITSGGALCVNTTSAGTMGNGSVIALGSSGGIIENASNSVANGSSLDIHVNTSGGGYQGFLSIASTRVGNANIRTQSTYSVFGRGVDSSFQLIASDNGNSGSNSFTLSTPSNGVIRVTNTSGSTAFVRIHFFGGTSV